MAQIEWIAGQSYAIKTASMTVPFYHLGNGQVVLMDSGLIQEGQDLLHTLHHAGFRVRAILTSHAHFDHVGNHNRIRSSDGAEIWASGFDAAVMHSALAMQAVLRNERLENIRTNYDYMICPVEHILTPEQTQLQIDGAQFGVVQLPGHAHSHTCYVTPDDVVYLADLMLGIEPLAKAKMLYAQCWQQAIQSIKKGCKLNCRCAVLAHGGVQPDLTAAASANLQALRGQLDKVLDCMQPWCTREEITEKVINRLNLRDRRPFRLRVAQRSVDAFIDYLQTLGQAEEMVQGAKIVYRRVVGRTQ